MTSVTSFSGEYAFLSNFYPTATPFEGAIYQTSEHAFQAAKTLDMEERRKVAEVATPAQAKRAGKRVTLRPNWDGIKIGIMKDIVRAKFKQDLKLIQKLKATADADLIEGNRHGDRFWGVCKGVGQNWLGRILMEVRAEFAADLGSSQ